MTTGSVLTSKVDPKLISDFFVEKDSHRIDPDVTPMKLAKLLYFAQGHYLASTGKRMFDADIEAFENGPVVYSEWSRYRGQQIICVRDDADPVPAPNLPDDIRAFLEEVWASYGHYSASELRRLSHSHKPWADHYTRGSFREVIPDGELAIFFRKSLPLVERVFHSGIVLVPDDLFAGYDEASVVAEARAFLNS